jgi:uncharacterized protein involved in outer membrane biogenesis
MPRMLKRLLTVLVSLILLIALLLAGIFFFVDPKDYQGRIADLVRKSTGRELAIEGDMGLCLFPRVGLILERVTLSNPAGMEGPPFAKASSLRVSVSLLPLLKKHLEITGLTVKGLELRLVRGEDGTTTWAFPSEPAEETVPVKTTPGRPVLPPGLSVAGVSLRNASVNFDDRRSGISFRVHKLRLTADRLTPGKTSEIDLAFTLESPRPALEATLEFSSFVNLAEDLTACTARKARLKVRASGEDVPAGKMDLELAATLDLDLEKGRIQVNDLLASLDETEVEGAFDLRDISLPAAAFDLRITHLNLDRYLNGKNDKAPSPAKAADSRGEATKIPSVLRTLDLEGRFRAERIQARRLIFEDIDVRVNAGDGLLRVEPVHATLYGGEIEARSTLDVRGQAALTTLALRAEQVQVGPVVQALAGEEKMTGTAEVDLDMRTRGLDTDAWLAHLTGPGSFAVRNGTVSFFGVPKDAEKEGTSTVNPFQVSDSPTPFETLDGSVSAHEGLLTNQDLRFHSQMIQAAGQGQVDLRQRSMDYDLDVILSYLPDVSVRIVGPISDPSVRVQPLKMLRRSVEDLGKGAMDVPEKVKDGVQGVGEGVLKLPGSIGDTFKGLFGGKD